MATSNSANCANATQMAVLLTSMVSGSLNGSSQMSYFRGANMQAAPHKIQWVNDALKNLTLSMTEESEADPYVFQRIGDYAGRVAVIITAPVLATVSAAAIDLDGGTNGGTAAKRMLIDDLPHSRATVRSGVTVDAQGTTFDEKLIRMSDYLVAMHATAASVPSDASVSGITAPTAFRQGSDFFPAVDAMARYCRFAPFYWIRRAIFRISSQDVDTVTPLSILAYHCMWSTTRLADECVHGSADESVLRAWSSVSERTFTVMLPFWWTASASQYMRARAWNNHELSVAITFAPLGEAIVGSPDHVSALTNGFGTDISDSSTFVCRTVSGGALGAYLTPIGGTFPAVEIAASQFSARIRFERVHAAPHERELLHKSKGKILIVTHKLEKSSAQLTNTQLTAANSEVHFQLQPKLSVAGFLFAVQRNSQRVQNKRMSYSSVPSSLYPLDGQVTEAQHLVSNIRLELNSDPIFSEGYDHLHRIQPACYSNNADIPAGLMYRGFCLGSPYALQKRGSLAVAAVDDKDLYILPNVNACASHVAEGGIAGESARISILSYTFNTISWEDGMASKDWL